MMSIEDKNETEEQQVLFGSERGKGTRMDRDYLFKVEHIYKAFGTTQALQDVSLMVKSGEIQGLIGENGSGKSTLASICAGIQKGDSGQMLFQNKAYRPNGTIDAVKQGVSMVVQEQGTIGMITVAANIFIGEEDMFIKRGIFNVRKMNIEAQKILDDIGAGHIDAKAMIDTLTFEDRKLVEIARSLYKSPNLLIIDETTTALTVTSRDILYSLMDKIKKSGGSVLFISHDIDEIMTVCDALTILRDGVFVARLGKEEFEADKIKQLMIGRELSGRYYRESVNAHRGETVVLEAKGVSNEILKDVSIKLYQGEILGIGGLSDCGMHEIGKTLFGLMIQDHGEVILNQSIPVRNAEKAVEDGMAYVSKNRDKESMMTVCSIKDNICLPSHKELSNFGLIQKKKEHQLSKRWMEALKIKARSDEQFCNTLSGGNKQKVVLAKWLAKGSDILILDCPTRGIDIGTKASIYLLIEDLQKQGKSIVLISEELPELIGMSDRVIVMKNGAISGEFSREEGLTEEKLIHKMI